MLQGAIARNVDVTSTSERLTARGSRRLERTYSEATRSTDLSESSTAYETWVSSTAVAIRLDGVVDVADRYRLVDVLTGCILDGAADITVNVGAISPVDTRVTDALATVRAHLLEHGGELHIRYSDVALGRLSSQRSLSGRRGTSRDSTSRARSDASDNFDQVVDRRVSHTEANRDLGVDQELARPTEQPGANDR